MEARLMTMEFHSLFYVWKEGREAKDTVYLPGISIGSVSIGYLVLEAAQLQHPSAKTRKANDVYCGLDLETPRASSIVLFHFLN